MNTSMMWHVEDGLAITSLSPYNSGAMTITDKNKDHEITMFLPVNQWWALYCVLPKADEFYVFTGQERLKDRKEIDAYLRAHITPHLKAVA